jgi:hypothetical protein
MSDPLSIGKNAEVRKVMEAFSIAPGMVVFRGCSRFPFSTAVDGSAPDRYLITYPLEATDSYLAPITHELAHVVQMRMYGGLEPLHEQLKSSLRIELGADYLAGLAYSRVLNNVSQDTFQHNLSLIGLYREASFNRHGTPAQRTGAFRYGLIDLMKADKSVERASQNFQANLYVQIIRF